MAASDDKQSENSRNWLRYLLALLITLAVSGYVGAILVGLVTVERRLDANSLFLIILAAGIVFLIVNPTAIEGLTSITFGSFKAEFAQLRLKQEDQERQVASMSAVLALLLTEEEQAQLLDLRRGKTAARQGSHDLRTLLRKLRGMRLLQMKTVGGNSLTVAAMEDGKIVDLSDFLTLTGLGTRIADELQRIELDNRAAALRGPR